jgi:hypothetical protein
MFKISRSNRLFQKSNILFLNRPYSTIKSNIDSIVKLDGLYGKSNEMEGKINVLREKLIFMDTNTTVSKLDKINTGSNKYLDVHILYLDVY